MDYTGYCGQTCDELYHFTFYLILLDTFRIPTDRVSPSQTLRCPGACDFPLLGYHILPTGLHGLCFGFCFAGPLPLHSLSHGPILRVHFRESLVVRLYSEFDHIHLSSEAQCVSHHLPQVDCHRRCITNFMFFAQRSMGRYPPIP